jgi:hypothetical protein
MCCVLEEDGKNMATERGLLSRVLRHSFKFPEDALTRSFGGSLEMLMDIGV